MAICSLRIWFTKKQTTISNGVFAFLNTTGLLADTGVRQAVRQGINMKQVRSVLENEQSLDYPILQSEIELNNYPAIPEYNLEAAKAAIATAGLAGETLQLATISTGYFPELASEFEAQLEKMVLMSKWPSIILDKSFWLRRTPA